VVIERGDVANSWRRERWDSLRLLTPNWQSRLPGFGYEGADPDGFMTMSEVIAFISRFAAIADPTRLEDLKEALAGTGTECGAGESAVIDAASRPVDGSRQPARGKLSSACSSAGF